MESNLGTTADTICAEQLDDSVDRGVAAIAFEGLSADEPGFDGGADAGKDLWVDGRIELLFVSGQWVLIADTATQKR